jgi:hypothetical protein
MGNPVTGAIPAAACRQFGPDVPQAMPGQPQGRPVDPDFTGGFYQPVRVLAPGPTSNIVAIGETRLTCDPAGAPPDQFTAFTQRYHPNTNPLVGSLGVKGAAAWAVGMPNRTFAGQHLTLEVSWKDCPMMDTVKDGFCGPDETGASCSTCGPGVAVDATDCCPPTPPAGGGAPAPDCAHPLGCTGAERYVRFDAPSASLVVQREGIAVSWFATGGAFDADVTGRAGTDPATSSDNGWLAPSQAGPILMWVVLSDDRGGTGWQTYSLDVQ